VRRYDEDGVVLLKGMFDEAWLKHLSEQIEVDIANPGPLHTELEDDGQTGRFFFDTFMWTYNPAFKQFVFESPAARIAAHMMHANKVNIFFDQLLIKEPGTVKHTPWHHDMPYWPLVGWQVCTIWLALDPVTKESGAVEYVRGSHKWGVQFNPTAFAGDDRYEQGMPRILDIEAMRHSLQLIQYELEPGDCTVHHVLLVHAAPGNTLDRLRELYPQGRFEVRRFRPNIVVQLRSGEKDLRGASGRGAPQHCGNSTSRNSRRAPRYTDRRCPRYIG